jgi:hypothetical protein
MLLTTTSVVRSMPHVQSITHGFPKRTCYTPPYSFAPIIIDTPVTKTANPTTQIKSTLLTVALASRQCS